MKRIFVAIITLLTIDRLFKVLVTASDPMWLADGVVLGPVYNGNVPGTMGLIAANGLHIIMPAGYLIVILLLATAIERGVIQMSRFALFILAVGLISNAVDMIIYPGVVDPIGIRIADPVFIGFNIADIYIVYGSSAVIASIILSAVGATASLASSVRNESGAERLPAGSEV